MAADLLTTISAEVDARRAQLRSSVEEYGQLLLAAAALEEEAVKAAAPKVTPPPRPAKAPMLRKPAVKKAPAASTAKPPAGSPRAAAQQAIVAALEHGSHTVAELTVVTALSGERIREGLRALIKAGTVTRAKRDGKAAYTLSG